MIRVVRLLAGISLLVSAAGGPVTAQQIRPLSEADFRDPPPEARPRVWWHWLNGNVTKDGITKDLEWMKRAGIGGVQTFDVNFQTPDVVPNRLRYMTPQWRDAFRFAAQETDRLGLELTVASSPGWSLTGGPWVKPEDGMKKLVWSETLVRGGSASPVRLAAPPQVTGPFQDIPLKPEPGADPNQMTPTRYGDVAVLAFPAGAERALPVPAYTQQSGQALDAASLTDGKLASGPALRRDGDGGASVTMTFAAPQTVRSLVAHLPGAADMFTGPALDMTLESSADGAAWQPVARFKPTLAPSTIGFAPVTASRFRLRMTAIDTLSPIDRMSAPGYAGVNYSLFLRQMPLQLAELRLSAEPKLDQFEAKAGFGIARDYYALAGNGRPGEPGVAPNRVIDLTGRLRPDGTLDWRPPRGLWRIVRLGWSLTGKTNHPAPAEATGLEVDKLDGRAVRDYMRSYISSYRETVGPDLIGARGINAILTDSTEVGAFNWSPGLAQAFRRLRGYDPTPWLPTLTGAIVGTREESDRFLFDWRRTISELHSSEHYRAVAEVAHEAGLKVYGEALEGWRVSLGDDIDMRRYTDVPMAAMWAFPEGVAPRPLLVADIRTAASSAHLRGLPLVAAESMTSSRYPWAMGPAELRRVVDTEFAHGVNRIIIHTSPHQPVDDKQPGVSLRHIGQFFTRHETWAGMARPWIDYIARSSYLLQQGRNVADVAYFPGEEAPAPTLIAEGGLSDLPRRYGYDYVNASAILTDLSVEGGDLVTAGGARYRALYLGGTSDRMTLPALRRIAELVRDGATVVGAAPTSSPSHADNARAFRQLARLLWRGGSRTQFGKGRVIAGTDVEGALDSIGVAPDVSANAAIMPQIEFVHRHLADGDIYFLRNTSLQALSFEASFRINGTAPEYWDAVTGKVSAVSYRIEGERTTIPVTLGPEESRFIVFRTPARANSLVLPAESETPVTTLAGPWSVAFENGRGAPVSTEMPTLTALNDNADPGIRYYSGVMTYRSSFILPAMREGEKLMLDLGRVGDIAEVRINGQLAGTVWQSPYKLDVSTLVRTGENTLEVAVANLWVNRLIGDAQPGATKIGWTTTPMYKADAPLRPAGLIGPIRLRSRKAN